MRPHGARLRQGVAVAAVAAAGFLAVWLATGGGSDPKPEPPYRLSPPRGEVVAFERAGPGVLSIWQPGVLAVRSNDEWQGLLARFNTSHRAPASSPPVDFTRETLLIVSYGGGGFCATLPTYVKRVEQVGDTLLVTLAWSGSHRPGVRGVCAPGYPPPADVVRVPRVGLPVRFAGWAPGFPVPPRATWLDPSPAGRIDTLTTRLRTLPPAAPARGTPPAPEPIRARATLGGEAAGP